MNEPRKAILYSRIVTVVEVKNGFTGHAFPPGTHGTIVECHEVPEEEYAVDVAIPDDTLVGGFAYDNVILLPHQFRVVPDGEGKPGNGDEGTDEVDDHQRTGHHRVAQSRTDELEPSAFVPYLGPESRKFCRAWDAFTGLATEGLTTP